MRATEKLNELSQTSYKDKVLAPKASQLLVYTCSRHVYVRFIVSDNLIYPYLILLHTAPATRSRCDMAKSPLQAERAFTAAHEVQYTQRSYAHLIDLGEKTESGQNFLEIQ